MKELEVIGLEFRTSRGMSPAGKRYDYNTQLVLKVENDELTAGIEPQSYLKLKRMLGENLTSLEKVMESSVKELGKSKTFFSFFCNKFIQPKLEVIFSEIDRVVIDTLNVHHPPLGYDLEASVYLINNHKLDCFNCPEAAVMAKLGKKKIYILEGLFNARNYFLKEKKYYQSEVIKHREKIRDMQRRMFG
ncbi:MAG: hypothetical protein ACTSRG_24065 [Candidatus Helarchaeota archaeon]